MGSFTTPFFKALFAGGLVEQVIAMIQANQGAAIEAYGAASPYGPLDPIVDFHKGQVLAPEYPCCTVVAGDPVFNKQPTPEFRDYSVNVIVHLDISYTDPEQTSDFAYHYARLLDQIISTMTFAFSSLAFFESSQPITWPAATSERQTAAFAPGTVKDLFLRDQHTGQVPGDEKTTPVTRISVLLEFHLIEQ